MTEISWPFDAGEGANVTEDEWRKMAKLWRDDGPALGLDDELLTHGDSTGMQIKVETGQAWVHGHYYQSDEQVVVAITDADNTDDRIDRVVLRADFLANTVRIAYLEGVAAGSPTAPGLTQGSSVWEIPLAQVLVAAGVSTIDAGDVTDERVLTPGADQRVYARYEKDNGPQSVGNNAAEPLGCNAFVEGFDVFQVTTTQWEVPPGYAGLYAISGCVSWDADDNGARRATIQINGNNRSTMLMRAAGGGHESAQLFFDKKELDVGDTIEVEVYQDCGGPLDVNSVPATHIVIERLGRRSTD